MTQVLVVLDLMELRVGCPGVTHFHHSIREQKQEQKLKLLAETTPLQTCFQGWRHITSLWNLLQCLTSLTMNFPFFPDRKASLAAARVRCPSKGHEQPPSLHKAEGTAAAMSKSVDFAQKSGKNWPLRSNVLYQEGMVTLCNFKSFISFSIHSNNMSEQYQNIQPKYCS